MKIAILSGPEPAADRQSPATNHNEIPAESARQSIAQSRAMPHNAHSSLSLHQPSFPCSAQIDNYQVALASGRQAWDRLALTASYRAASRVVLWALALFPSNPRGQTNPCSLPLETPTARPAHLSPWSCCLAIAVAAAHLACHRLDPHTAALPPPPPILPFDNTTLPAGVSFDAAANSFSLDPTNAAFSSLAAGHGG